MNVQMEHTFLAEKSNSILWKLNKNKKNESGYQQ